MAKNKEKKVKKYNGNTDEVIELDIPEEEIWTYQIEGMKAPHINKPWTNFTLKKVIFTVGVILAVSLSIFFSVQVLRSDTLSYTEIENGYLFSSFRNTGFISEIDVDYVSDIEYIKGEADMNKNFKFVKDESKPVTEIREYAFNCDEKLQIINIGADVKKIDAKSFYTCRQLQCIYVDENNPYYCDIDGVLYTKDLSEIVCYPMSHGAYLERSFLPELLKGVFVESFEEKEWNDMLATIEKAVADYKASIGDDNAKYEDDPYRIAELYNENLPLEENTEFIRNAFEVKFGWEAVNEAMNKIYQTKEYTKKVLTYILPSNVKKISDMCFNYTNLSVVYLPEGLKEMGTMCFFKSGNLSEIFSYKCDDDITQTAFTSDDVFTSVYKSLPEGLEYIGSDAFSTDQALTYVYIPSSVNHIGHHAFFNCIYKDGDWNGLLDVNVAVSEDEFKSNAVAGDQWVSEYSFLNYIDVNYGAQRV